MFAFCAQSRQTACCLANHMPGGLCLSSCSLITRWAQYRLVCTHTQQWPSLVVRKISKRAKQIPEWTKKGSELLFASSAAFGRGGQWTLPLCFTCFHSLLHCQLPSEHWLRACKCAQWTLISSQERKCRHMHLQLASDDNGQRSSPWQAFLHSISIFHLTRQFSNKSVHYAFVVALIYADYFAFPKLTHANSHSKRVF